MHDYRAQEDKRTREEQLEQGWRIARHPRTGAFYTFDPARKSETFGARSFTPAEVKALVKQGILEPLNNYCGEHIPVWEGLV